MSAPTVSILMANYNGARHLAQAVETALAQTLGDFELLIADDASTDDSVEIIEGFARRDRRVRLLAAPANGGPAAARNRALDAAQGRWLAVFDSDDLIAPDRLQALVQEGEASGAAIVADDLEVFLDGQTAPGRPFLGWTGGPRWITAADYINSSRMYARRPNLGYLKPLFRRSALGQARYRQDLKIGEDYDLVLRLLARGARMRIVPTAYYRYRKHAASISARMTAADLEQMLAADAEASAALRDGPAQVAQARRTRSLRAALAYDGVICDLKAGRIARGLRQGLARPDIWPLLTMPVTARLHRAFARLRRPA